MNKLFLIAVISLFTLSLFSIPYGVLGNINMPDAYILPSKMVEVSLTNYFVINGTNFSDFAANAEAQAGDQLEDLTGGAENYNLAFSASVGLFDRLELGLVATNYDMIYGNVKLKLYSETEKFPAISVGMENLFSKTNMPKGNRVDICIASKSRMPRSFMRAEQVAKLSPSGGTAPTSALKL